MLFVFFFLFFFVFLLCYFSFFFVGWSIRMAAKTACRLQKDFWRTKRWKKTQQDVSLQNDHRFLSGGRKEMVLRMICLVEIQAQFCSEGGPSHFVVLRMVKIIFL